MFKNAVKAAPLTAAAAVSAAGAALGEEPGETAPAAEGLTELDTLIVTARRREERAQDVPIALSLISGSDLARTGAYTIQQSGSRRRLCSTRPPIRAIRR